VTFSAQYVARRLGAAVLVLLVVITGTFLLSHAIPADPARAAAGLHAGVAQVRAVSHQLGLDQPLWDQYGTYMANVLRGNLGISYVSRTSIAPQLAAAVPATLELVVYSFLVCAIFGVIAGMGQAWWPRKVGTHLVRGTSILGTALPVFWFAIILQLVFAARLAWFPIESRLSSNTIPPPHITGFYTLDALLTGRWTTFGDAAAHLVLPVLSLVAWMFALTSRVAEKSFATELTRPYVQTAKARGVTSGRLLWRHVLRNALNPIITMLGLQFGWLLGGTILVEVVFSWGGIGSVMYTALQNFDYPVIEAVTLVSTIAFVVVNLCVDLLYPVIDPRIRSSG
jgi:ABC-type dipeptide/oligopeptide/nickel transport system permease component